MEKVYMGSPDSASMPASCFLPSVEKMSIKNYITGQSISAPHQYSSLEFSQRKIFLVRALKQNDSHSLFLMNFNALRRKKEKH